MKTVDLHIHTTYSDGASTPSEVVDLAVSLDLSAISITDHDSVEGLPEGMARAREAGIEFVPGMELSVEIGDFEVHLLGYLFDYRDPELRERLADFRAARWERAGMMLERLRGLGVDLDLARVFPDGPRGAVGRLHIARAMFLEGKVSSVQEAFSRYIGNQGPAYVPKLTFSLEEALDTIRRLGGISVLAHPGQLKKDDLIPGMVELGLGGLEAYYPSHTQFETNHYIELARHYGLAATGGSDCHGANKGRILMGAARVPYLVLEELKRIHGGTPE